MATRRSLYPNSQYPQPLVDPAPAFETTYGHHHCSHPLRDSDHFRSRTLNPQTRPSSVPSAPAQSIYPRHGTGQFVIPYYRRDSTGFRRPFHQPNHVDENYSATKTVDGLIAGGMNWVHPSSRPTYSVAKGIEGQGAVFGTSYRNSGLYDSDNAAFTSRVTKTVAQNLQAQKSQQGYAATQRGGSQSAEAELGHYTGEVRDSPPTDAESYAISSSYVTDSLPPAVGGSRAVLGDPLLADPYANAYRKARTVYKRSFGLCQ